MRILLSMEVLASNLVNIKIDTPPFTDTKSDVITVMADNLGKTTV